MSRGAGRDGTVLARLRQAAARLHRAVTGAAPPRDGSGPAATRPFRRNLAVPRFLHRAIRSRRAQLATLGLALLLGTLAALDRALPPDLTRWQQVSPDLRDREGRPLAVLPASGGVWRLATTTADVPPHLLDLLIAAEDRRFRWHPGVDPFALARASLQWLRAGRVVSGGSTLTMQAVRLLEPRPRTLRSKLIEAARAVQLEWRYSKAEILGIWLTLAPQGGNLEGIRAGALAWFGRSAAQLDVAEAALLVAVPRQPERTRPDRHPAAAEAARTAVLHARARGARNISEADRALAAAVPSRRLPMPNLAPHVARELARASTGPLRTTLDANLQRAAEDIAASALRRLPPRVSVALILADWRSREVRALVGGQFNDPDRAGALDLTRAVRSPGSALKPLLYAMAFEAGIAQPGTLLDDLPRRFGSYAPENLDRGFAGRITVAEALRHSLNLPAVALLHEIGPLRFASALKAAGAPPRLPPGNDPALPLALGGAGETLRDMATLYATLADGGRAAPLRYTPSAAEPPRRQVLERRAAAMLTGILVQPFPAGGPAGIAWKTGTSWGGRDAWAMGFDGQHVVGVWVGRPDGTPMINDTGLPTGARLALPLLAQAFERLPANPREGSDARAIASPMAERVDRLRLLFPPQGAVLAEGESRVTLRAAGGRRPLVFLVDGKPLAHEAAKREAAWSPEGPGFYRVTVLDADGIAAAAQVRVR
jgi:penicillin-binding protein 1C